MGLGYSFMSLPSPHMVLINCFIPSLVFLFVWFSWLLWSIVLTLKNEKFSTCQETQHLEALHVLPHTFGVEHPCRVPHSGSLPEHRILGKALLLWFVGTPMGSPLKQWKHLTLSLVSSRAARHLLFSNHMCGGTMGAGRSVLSTTLLGWSQLCKGPLLICTWRTVGDVSLSLNQKKRGGEGSFWPSSNIDTWKCQSLYTFIKVDYVEYDTLIQSFTN